MISFLDYTGLTFGLIGAILIGRKMKEGFLAFIIASTSYLLMGYLLGTIGLTLQSLMFIIIDVYYYRRWKRDE